MNDEKAILSEAYDRIKSLMQQDKWQDAHRACLEILRIDPDNLKIIRLKNKIEGKVKKINIKALKDDLKNIEPLWAEKKYEELLEHLKELEPYRDEYYPLKKLMIKAQKAYDKQFEEKKRKYYGEEMKFIDELLSKHEYQEAIRGAHKLRLSKINESEIKQLIKKIKQKWVDFELSQCKSLLSSEKYEDILIALQGIKRINPQNKTILKLIESKKKKYRTYKTEEKKDFVLKGVDEIQILLQKKKYEKAVQMAKKIIDIEPNNPKIQYLFLKSKKKFAKSTDKELYSQMKIARKDMHQKYKSDKKNVIKI